MRAAIGAVRERAEGPTLVFGWSFGASVALREAFEDERVSALALFGAPLRPNDLELPPMPTPAELRLLKRPLLLLAGANDEYCPADELRAYGEGVAEVVIMEGTDHYLWRREREAAAIVGDFADRVLASWRSTRAISRLAASAAEGAGSTLLVAVRPGVDVAAAPGAPDPDERQEEERAAEQAGPHVDARARRTPRRHASHNHGFPHQGRSGGCGSRSGVARSGSASWARRRSTSSPPRARGTPAGSPHRA